MYELPLISKHQVFLHVLESSDSCIGNIKQPGNVKINLGQ